MVARGMARPSVSIKQRILRFCGQVITIPRLLHILRCALAQMSWVHNSFPEGLPLRWSLLISRHGFEHDGTILRKPPWVWMKRGALQASEWTTIQPSPIWRPNHPLANGRGRELLHRLLHVVRRAVRRRPVRQRPSVTLRGDAKGDQGGALREHGLVEGRRPLREKRAAHSEIPEHARE